MTPKMVGLVLARNTKSSYHPVAGRTGFPGWYRYVYRWSSPEISDSTFCILLTAGAFQCLVSHRHLHVPWPLAASGRWSRWSHDLIFDFLFVAGFDKPLRSQPCTHSDMLFSQRVSLIFWKPFWHLNSPVFERQLSHLPIGFISCIVPIFPSAWGFRDKTLRDSSPASRPWGFRGRTV